MHWDLLLEPKGSALATNNVEEAFLGTCIGTCYLNPLTTDNVVEAAFGTCIETC